MATVATKKNPGQFKFPGPSDKSEGKEQTKEIPPKGLFSSATNIVIKAAGILEEEIARGIIAAKKIEGKFTDSSKVKNTQMPNNQQLDDLFVRFRKDAHDIIDLVVDITSLALQNAERIGSNLIKTGSSKTSAEKNGQQQMPLIQVPKDLKPGEKTSFPVVLENDSVKEEKTIVFMFSPFADSKGNQLGASSLLFDPNPLQIPVSSRATVQVTIQIPKTAKKGAYSCFVQGKDTESLKASVMVKVI